MSEQTKFTEDELTNVNELQGTYLKLQGALGQVSIGRIRLQQQLDEFDKAEATITKQFGETQTQLKLKDPIDDDVLLDYIGDADSSALEVSFTPINNDLREEHVTVIRKAPKIAPTFEMKTSDRDGETTGTQWVSGSNSAGGRWVSGSTYEASQSFDHETSDMRMNVTDIVKHWLSGSHSGDVLHNNGFIVKRSGSIGNSDTNVEEGNTNRFGQFKFPAKEYKNTRR